MGKLRCKCLLKASVLGSGTIVVGVELMNIEPEHREGKKITGKQ